MPWTKEQVKEHKKGLTDAQEEQWVEVANSVLKKCMEDGGTEETCAVSAIKQANGAVERSEEKLEPETRIINDEDSEIRTVGKTRIVEGYAIVFNSLSRDLGGFKEIILPSAMDGMIENSDVLALLNHDLNKGVLARSTNGKGSLELSIDQKGVRYRFSAPNTALGDELLEGIRRNDIRTSSFSFNTDRDGQVWDTRSRPAIRTVKKFTSFTDVSPVYREAYENTNVALRSLDELNNTVPIIEIKPDAAKTAPEPIIKEKRKLTIREENLRQANEAFKKGNYLNIKHYFK